ncbi:MAG: lipopolysaccharide biosynthesis protein [Pirellulales bacterium]|nr:lipopolysaccharide biosynthesis protein [Pirellulales bacterium]
MIERVWAAASALLPKGRLARSALVVSSGHVAGYAVMLLATPLLTRLYSPADFGVYAVYTSLIAMLGLVSMACYEAAIPLPEDDRTAHGLVLLSLGICLVTASGMAVVIRFGGETLLGRLQAGELAGLFPLFAVQLIGSGSCETLTNWFVRSGRFAPIARVRLAASVVNASVQIALAFLTCGAVGLVAGSAAGAVVGGGYLLVLFFGAWSPRSASAADVWNAAVRYRRFPQLSMPSTLLHRTAILLPPLALASLYDSQVVGWYGLAQRALIVPLSLIGPPLSRVYLAEASRLHREGLGRLRRLFLRTAEKQLLYAGLPLLVLVLAAPALFAVAFGEPWREAGVYCQMVFPMLLLFIIASVLAATLDVLERQDLQLLRSTVSLGLMMVGLIVPWWLAAPPRVAVAALSGAGSAGYLLTLWLVWRAIPRDRLPQEAAPGVDRGPREAPFEPSQRGLTASSVSVSVGSHD